MCAHACCLACSEPSAEEADRKFMEDCGGCSPTATMAKMNALVGPSFFTEEYYEKVTGRTAKD
jgi:hypothetical protein